MDSIDKFLSLGTSFVKNNSVIAFRILFEPLCFLNSLQLHSKSEFYRAFEYAIFISLVGLVFLFPILKLAGVQFESISFLIIDTVVTLFILISFGIANYILCRILRSKVTMQSSIILTIYFSTILYLINFLIIPFSDVFSSLLINGSISEAEDKIGEKILETPSFMFLSFMMFIVPIYWVYIQTKAFKYVASFGWFRVVFFSIGSTISIYFLSMVLGYPMMVEYSKAFSK